jgi:hypothetical protein
MRFVISYDLEETDPDPHKPFLTAAANHGLLYVFRSKNYVNRLPNTTVWGEFNDINAAKMAFKAAIAEAAKVIGRAINVEKVFVAWFEECYIDSDVYRTPDPKWTGKTAFETSRLHQLNDPIFR